MTLHIQTIDKLEHRKPLHCVYNDSCLIGAFPREGAAKAYQMQLRAAQKRIAGKRREARR